MRSALVVVVSLASPLVSSAEKLAPRRPVHTYLIVARDAATGQIGVAVQLHWFSRRLERVLGRGRCWRRRDPIVHRPRLRKARARSDARREKRAERARGYCRS